MKTADRRYSMKRNQSVGFENVIQGSSSPVLHQSLLPVFGTLFLLVPILKLVNVMT